MRWSDLLRMSAGSLKRRKLRAFLTILGVVIGTASIVVMISLGLGLQQSMYEQMELDGGTTGLTVTGKSDDGMMNSYSTGMSDQEETKKYITDETIKELKTLEHVKSADPVLDFSALALKGKYEGYIQLYGMTPEAMQRLNLELEPGADCRIRTVRSWNSCSGIWYLSTSLKKVREAETGIPANSLISIFRKINFS